MSDDPLHLEIDAVGRPVARDPRDPLRLRFCPNCDYSREGLTEGAPCPECGMRCDSRFIVLQSDTGCETEPARRKWQRWLGVSLLGAFVAFFFVREVRQSPAVALAWFAPTFCMWLLVSWYQLFGWRRAQQQLWLHEKGFELTQSTESARKVQPLMQWVIALSFPWIMVMPTIASMRSLASALIIFALTSPIMLAGVLTALRRKRWPTRIVVTAGDFTRRLIPWAALERCEVTESPANRVKVHFKWTARIVGRIFTADDAVRLDAPFDRERLPALRTQVALWRARAQAGT